MMISRLRRFGTVLASVAGMLSIAAASGRQDRLAIEVHAWTNDVREHEPGVPDEPAKRIAALPWDTHLPILNKVKQRGDPELLLLAASAFLDIAVHIPLEQRPLLSKLGSSTITEDGGRRGAISLDPHLSQARQLVDRVSRDETLPQYAEMRSHAIAWYRTVTAVLLAANNLADLDSHIERSTKLFPDDPGILFDAGCYAEAYASPLIQAAMFARGDSAPKPQRRVGLLQADPRSESRLLGEAERRFRRVIELDPTFTEARVRLGFVLIRRGHPELAIPELERARALSTDDVVRYYAELFLGRAFAAVGEHARAVAANTAAAARFPSAQSPRLALSLLHADTGRATRDDLLDVLTQTDDASRVDPWWVYYRGSGRNEADAYRAFVARIRAVRGKSGGKR
mgnify:CR=1 FL=1|jgi:tetratricopeptide (TPR) repeat protein